jgi:flagellar export protein FliJ
MSARATRLDTLLRVRRIEEEIRRGRLATAAHAERAAQGRLQKAHQQYALAGRDVAAGDAAPAPLRDFLAARRRQDTLAGTVRVAGGAATEAEGATGAARAGWTAAAMRLAALERLDERSREADRLARLATDQRTAEESASRRPSCPTMTQGRTA